MEQYIWKQVGSVTERSLFLGYKKRIWSAGDCWESERSLLKKQKRNKWNVAILHGSKQIGGRRGAETLQYRILSDLQLLPSARTKASVRFSTERKTNGALLQRCKSRRTVCGTWWGSILLLLGQRRLFYARHGNRAVWGD